MSGKIKSMVSSSGLPLLLLLAVVTVRLSADGKGRETPDRGNIPVTEAMEGDGSVSFRDGDGKVVSLTDLKGKVVFINFWATWCPPCIHEMPSINTLKGKFEGNDGIVFLMVDVDGNHKNAQAFMDKRKFDLPVYVPEGEIPGEYLGSAIPTTIILSKNGTIEARIEGGRDYSSPQVEKALNELIERD